MLDNVSKYAFFYNIARKKVTLVSIDGLVFSNLKQWYGPNLLWVLRYTSGCQHCVSAWSYLSQLSYKPWTAGSTVKILTGPNSKDARYWRQGWHILATLPTRPTINYWAEFANCFILSLKSSVTERAQHPRIGALNYFGVLVRYTWKKC